MAHPASTPPNAQGSVHPPEHHGSFMPLFLAIGATLFLLGLVYTPLAVVGLLVVGASIVGWVREDVHELRGKPFSQHASPYLFGAITLILSEIVLFGVLFTYYFWSASRQGASFVPDEILHMDMLPIYVNTALLVSSGVTVEIAKWRMKRDDAPGFRLWMSATVLLGAAFVVGQAREYFTLVQEGITPAGSIYGTAFFSLTGVHGLHVVAGIVVLSLLLGLSYTGFVRKERLSGMEGAFLYWHFVDAIWILVFSFVYLRVI